MSHGHPCAGHDCDHCWICDGLGICCLTVPHLKALLIKEHSDPPNNLDQLKAAIEADVQSGNVQLSFRQLIALDAQARAAMAAPASGQLPSPIHNLQDAAQANGHPLQLPAAPETPFLSKVRADAKHKKRK